VATPILLESKTQPHDVFDPWSGSPVTNWTELNKRINEILALHGGESLVWRGVVDADWGLYSSLYRRLKMTRAKIQDKDMLNIESQILERARKSWRFDNLSAMEIFAQVQHYGGPTRLLDVTLNPLIASWFAVEQKRHEDGQVRIDVDSRIFCFYVGEFVNLSDWGGPDIPWAKWQDLASRKAKDWGTGEVRRVWRPPAYNERISAQNGAFLIDGVPFTYPGSNQFTKGPGMVNDRWRIGAIRDASSIPMKLNDPSRQRQTAKSTPAFTFKIAATARDEIRERLERNYGYSAASLYSDLFGLAQFATPQLPI
jgi:hypothetical protein